MDDLSFEDHFPSSVIAHSGHLQVHRSQNVRVNWTRVGLDQVYRVQTEPDLCVEAVGGEHLSHRHLVFGQSSSFVRTDHVTAA